jgi:hypothetical protein
VKALLLRIAKRFKIVINFFLDRITDLCNYLIFWAAIFPTPIQNLIKTISYFIGNLVLWLVNFPRMDAYKLTGKEWSITFVGSREGLQAAQELFFEAQESTTQVLERVKVWKLPEQSKDWLAGGADLVICELSRLTPWKPSAVYSFSGPDWIMQIIDLPASPEEILVGRRISSQRKRILKLEKNGFSYHYSRAREDFLFFYHHMYLPFVNARHGSQALIVPLEDQHNRWFKAGGLILVTESNQPVAGAIVIRTGKICYNIEMGVLRGAPELMEAGVIAFLDWSTIQWCYTQSAKQLCLGGSQAYCSNGSFDSKTKWGARVVRQKRVNPLWFYLSDHLPDSLRERMNQIELVSEQKGKFYCTYIAEPDAEDLERKVQEALRQGLSGLALVQNGTVQYLTANQNPD